MLVSGFWFQLDIAQKDQKIAPKKDNKKPAPAINEALRSEKPTFIFVINNPPESLGGFVSFHCHIECHTMLENLSIGSIRIFRG